MAHKRRKTMFLFLLPALILIISIQFAPMIYNFVLSFFNIQINKPNLELKFLGIDNYVYILSDKSFWNSVIVTLKIAITSVALQMLLGLGLALLLNT